MEPTGAELARARAHEIRNPVASIAGCASTLLESGSRLDEPTRRALLEVIVEQARRLEWLVRAAAEDDLDAEPGRVPVDVAALVRAAASFAGYVSVAAGPLERPADERRLRVALEALLLALRPASHDGVAVVEQAGDVILIRTAGAGALADGERAWKLALARRILHEQGATLTLRVAGELIEARVEPAAGRQA